MDIKKRTQSKTRKFLSSELKGRLYRVIWRVALGFTYNVGRYLPITPKYTHIGLLDIIAARLDHKKFGYEELSH